MTQQNVPQRSMLNQNVDDIDWGKIFGSLVDGRWLIVAITFFFTAFAIAYALLATPVYKADALLQVEQKSSGMKGLGDLGEMMSPDISSTTEIEIIKSRMVLGKTVDNLNLSTVVAPDYMPFVGKGIARLTGNVNSLDIPRFDISDSTSNLSIRVQAHSEDDYSVIDRDGNVLVKGKVGELLDTGTYRLQINHIEAEPEKVFTITKISRLNAVNRLQKSLQVAEKGRKTGILQLTMSGVDRKDIETVLNDITLNYFLQNVARNSAEAEKSLQFLQSHLPEIRAQLTEAEDNLNQFRQKNASVDLGFEAKTTLTAMVQLESQLNELTFTESEISKRFTTEHPQYVALLDKKRILMQERDRLNQMVQKLPKTQREILRLTRNVEVNQEIFVQLLNKVQELNIAKASTVGNVRILDKAQAYSAAVKPRKTVIVAGGTVLGLMFGVLVVLGRALLNRGVESPDEIEAIGLPVYASVPMSDWQIELEKKQNSKRQLTVEETLLAISNPADLSIEALRSLRTSLHFAMMEAKNNILMISGPSPGIGKSFVSANMAAVIAKSGQKVLVIDADMRKGRMEKQLSVNPKPGLSDFLSGQATINELIKYPGVDNMAFIGRGDVPPNPSELLMHPRFKELMDWGSENFDIVIVDTPPILAVTDPAIVGAHAGTTLLVGRFGQNAVKEIEVTKQRFEQNGIEVKGFILNAVVRKASSYYGGNYGYYNYSYDSNK